MGIVYYDPPDETDECKWKGEEGEGPSEDKKLITEDGRPIITEDGKKIIPE